VAKEKAIIVDVDGTLADMRGVRSPFEWDKVLQDKPHLDVIDQQVLKNIKLSLLQVEMVFVNKIL
jgi:hypothetical protein